MNTQRKAKQSVISDSEDSEKSVEAKLTNQDSGSEISEEIEKSGSEASKSKSALQFREAVEIS